MIYLAPICSTTLAIVKRWRPSLLVVPLCMLLVGCDSASSNTEKDMVSTFATTNSEPQGASQSFQDDNAESATNDESSEMAEGQSLIAAAQSNKDTYADSSMERSEAKSSMLQATLMGDYGGMVSCIDCDSIDVTLNLFADGSVLKASYYHNPEKPKTPLLESGIYRQDNDKITIVYEGKNIETYHIQDNHLIRIDEHDNLEDDYTLSRK
ncbi:copper resistance protein NlpE N-terminal domain-containing protein [Psychrobacter nivimaris]|uniref:copper resistance protein NlpE N-terminal domain-containing protein n=1 Tax=Psychrobacter nivimaris TaxID=281738 RepID=UPI001919935A|nr:copper resistance protein NlpE N-terminal domain-containing protein [Psychrobacter nivimaris]